MAATTHITVICPNCAKECGVSFRAVETSVDKTLNDMHGAMVVVSLVAEIRAEGPHRCSVPNPLL